MVGDWIKGDVLGAKKVGLVSCLAKYGAPDNSIKKLTGSSRFKKYKSKPDCYLNKFEDIIKVVKKYT